MFMIGAILDPVITLDMVTGVRLVDKMSGKKSLDAVRIELWFSNFEDTPAVDKLRASVERCLAYRSDGSKGAVPKMETKTHIVSAKI